MRNTLILLVISVFFFSCIEEYTIPKEGTLTMASDIVIQGRILSGDKSIVYIARTQPLNSKEENESVPNAQVTIIGQNGYETSSGKFDDQQQAYQIETKDLPNNTHYAIKVELDGETYQSRFQPIYDTPEIENITYKEHEDGISIHVSTSNTDSGAKGYMWSYEEDWEFHADFNMASVNDGIVLYNESIYQIEGTKNPYYYCWQNQKSNNIFIYEEKFELIHSQYEPECIWKAPTESNSHQYEWDQLIKQGAIAITTNGSYSKFKNPDFLKSILYSKECVDCRAVEGATKKRPDFWPNNHE